MTMQENGNLVKLFRNLGMEQCLGDIILGIEGSISPEEAAEAIKKKVLISERKEVE